MAEKILGGGAHEAGSDSDRKFSELVFILHPDHGGTTEETQKLLEARQASNNGDPAALDALYETWFSPEAVAQREIRVAFSERSKFFHGRDASGKKAEHYKPTAEDIGELYQTLCDEKGIAPDLTYIADFLYENNFISDVQRDGIKSGKLPPQPTSFTG